MKHIKLFEASSSKDYITVGDLKERIADLPDETPVVLFNKDGVGEDMLVDQITEEKVYASKDDVVGSTYWTLASQKYPSKNSLPGKKLQLIKVLSIG